MNIVLLANKIFAIGIIAGQIGIVSVLVYWLLLKKTFPAVNVFLVRNGLFFAFIVSLASTLGSLFYSQIAGFAPCELCWFQRIFMYPQVILLGLALIKKDSRIVDYALSLSLIGGVISLYHNYVYFMNGGLNSYCVVGGQGVSCIKRYVLEFGYITIPVMAFTAFLMVVILLLFSKMAHKKG
jgi:disulfide bond formation protein DsbB